MAEAAPTIVNAPLVDESTVRRISRAAGEGAGLFELRRGALEILEETPLPDRVRHLWRFTDPRKLLPGEINPPVSVAPAQALAEASGRGSRACLNVRGDGFEIHLSPEAEAAGVRLCAMAEAPGVLETLGSIVPASTGFFEALNLTAFTAGLVVDVPDGVELDEPVRLIIPAVRGPYMPRILVRVGRAARVTVLEEHLGGGSSSRMVSVTEVLADAAAQVWHVVVQHWNPGVRGHLTSRGRIGRDAKVTLVIASLGGDLAKMNVGAVLDAPGAQSEIGGVVLGAGRQHMDHHTLHDHRAPNTMSNIDFKVALTGKARSAYTGLIRIEKEAPASEAYQENRNLLLSEGARADTIPELEILTDNVQCTHGATVAPMDEEQLFYLESRCIPPKEARRLIVQGFLEAALSRLPGELREELEATVSGNLSVFLDTPEDA